MPAPIPTDTVRPQSERKASPTARGPWPRSQSETTPTTTRNGVALNGRIPANPTAEDLLHFREPGKTAELVRGVLIVREPPGTGHGGRSARLTLRVGAFVEQRELGEVFAQDTGFKIERDPDTVRAPDVAFVP